MNTCYLRSGLMLLAVILSFGIMAVQIPALAYAANGCGPEGFWGIFVPNYLFEKACNEHDNCYEFPAKKSREECDADFYQNMRRACDGQAFPSIQRGLNFGDDWTVWYPVSSQEQRDEYYVHQALSQTRSRRTKEAPILEHLVKSHGEDV